MSTPHLGIDIDNVTVEKDRVVITFIQGGKLLIRAKEEFSYTHPNGNRSELETEVTA